MRNHVYEIVVLLDHLICVQIFECCNLFVHIQRNKLTTKHRYNTPFFPERFKLFRVVFYSKHASSWDPKLNTGTIAKTETSESVFQQPHDLLWRSCTLDHGGWHGKDHSAIELILDQLKFFPCFLRVRIIVNGCNPRPFLLKAIKNTRDLIPIGLDAGCNHKIVVVNRCSIIEGYFVFIWSKGAYSLLSPIGSFWYNLFHGLDTTFVRFDSTPNQSPERLVVMH
mmetsp:Transcript_17744/g.32087  ORF Transcript_17744/g.32087 Transcript_17744/m.32087 type:complete len:224 (+) Transcript_17744:769-1440(+)